MSEPTDLLGAPLNAAEKRIVTVYQQLKDLLGRDDLAPSTQANLRNALAAVAIAVTDLGLVFEHLTELEI
ncbi:hypothetical protein [Amycolatopsis pithecellobii]|uniref:Uncharacterized protein n=1 Tax=Amycolatopsis pithecellobii TaxID=664692 RepID=A0A6N7Z5P3_9PSEU|nr:hypothetical protein [Amycolatopsis pithecellobii]MTD56051.1 hypothetical protein [Amycolatopsis pithecellobii]